MTTLLVIPNSFTVLSTSTSTGPNNLKNDEPGLVWRTTGSGTRYLTVETSGTIDTIALAGTTLTAADSVRVRLGHSQAEVNGSSASVDMTAQILAGDPVDGRSFLVASLNEPADYTHIRFDFTLATASSVEVSRLIVGKSLQTAGIDINPEYSFENATENALNPKTTKPSWKVTISDFSDAEFWGSWNAALRTLADKRGFLFVPDLESDYAQQQALFGQMAVIAKGNVKATNYTSLDMTIQSVM